MKSQMLAVKVIAKGVAMEAGLPDTDNWPWSWETADGIKAWTRFAIDVTRYGMQWARLELEGMASVSDPEHEPTFLEPGREQRFANLVADGEAKLDGESSPEFRELVKNALRERAKRMVDAGMTDHQIDEAIQLSDHADRIVIWQFVNALRAQDGMPREVSLKDLPEAEQEAFQKMLDNRDKQQPWGGGREWGGGPAAERSANMQADLAFAMGAPVQPDVVTQPEPTPLRVVPPASDRIATPEDAVAAYEQHGSDRKAAKALGISRTQLRRLRGAEK